MTGVETLRQKVLSNYPKIKTNPKGMERLIRIVESVDDLILAAEEAGAQKERAAILKECKVILFNNGNSDSQESGFIEQILAPREEKDYA